MATTNTKRTTVSNDARINNMPAKEPEHDTSAVFSFFERGPKDIAARVDAYGQELKELGTNINNTMSKWTDDAFKKFEVTNKSFGGFNLGGIQDKINGAVNYFKQTQNEINDRCKNLLGRDLKSLQNLPKEFKNDMVGTIASLTGNTNVAGFNVGSLVKEGKMKYDEARSMYQVIKSQNWTSLAGIQQGLNILGGNSFAGALKPYLDLQATSAFIGSLAHKAVDLGIPDLVTQVCRHFDKNGLGKSEKGRYLNLGVYNAAHRGDLATIDVLIDQLGGDNVNSTNPKLIQWVLQNYKHDELYTPDRLPEYRERLLKTLTGLNPNWDSTLRDDVYVTRLDVFKGISKDAQQLLTYQVKTEDGQLDGTKKNYRTEIMLANSYPERDIKMLVLGQYKNITFKNRPQDPRKKW